LKLHRVHLEVCGLILSHCLAFPKVWMWFPSYTLGLYLSTPLALVVSPKLMSWQFDIYFCKFLHVKHDFFKKWFNYMKHLWVNISILNEFYKTHQYWTNDELYNNNMPKSSIYIWTCFYSHFIGNVQNFEALIFMGLWYLRSKNMDKILLLFFSPKLNDLGKSIFGKVHLPT